MLIIEDIPQLVADDFRLANGSINIGMGMTIYPYIDTAVGYEIAQFRSKDTVDERVQMLWCHHLPCRQVMGNHNYFLSRTLHHALPDEIQAEQVQLVIFIHLNELPFVFGLTKIIQPFPYEILLLWGNVRPQRTQDEVCVINPNHLILIDAHIVFEHPFPLQAPLHHVTKLVKLMVAWHYHNLTVVG